VYIKLQQAAAAAAVAAAAAISNTNFLFFSFHTFTLTCFTPSEYFSGQNCTKYYPCLRSSLDTGHINTVFS
jgi:hypothetical protein